MSLNLQDTLTGWLISREEHLYLSENHDNIVLHRYPQCLMLKVQLQQPPLPSQLHMWMRLGGASLNHFEGSLSMDPDGALWLVQCLHEELGQAPLEHCLETLLNQRDTWRAMISRLANSKSFTPTSLRQSRY